ncbi:RNA polymerase III RPC4-domain-containing protein [Daldinia vernicosa]|uniref:RNA polymerase III RPC4-domain-containing protein n=1 Tax=Daldinia vernicosa TaxID=114800 RepID=UPI002008AB45|nr:RNA polymerase III RPC4-domain-containing protein [Daldinia vernicosa]KAI0848581.1 RNA polymerase III RPC4-domain-containing protein [Daldinia vernicosa]
MPPRGSRGGRGGRGRGAARAGHSSSDTTNRASLGDAESHPAESSSQPQTSIESSDIVVISTPSEGTPIDSPPVSALQSDPSVTTSLRQSQTPSATASRAGGRFRPKNVRRDAAERARLEQERNRDLAVKIKEEERQQRAEGRRARRGRGRGDPSQRGFIRRTVTASGPFSAIPQDIVKAGAGGWGWGANGGASSSKGGFTPQFNALRYRPRRENEDRVNVDLLNGTTGYDEEGNPLYQPSRFTKSTGNLPVGLLRTHHEEDEVKVKTTAELEAEDRQSSDDDELFVTQAAKDLREIGMEDDSEVWHAAPKSQVKIKAEPGTEPEAMDVDMADIPEAAQIKAPPSPELKKKLAVNEDSAAIAQRKRKEKAAKDPEILQTLYDLDAQLQTLKFDDPPSGEKEGEKDEGQEDDEAPQGQEKDDQMYLFQLPPILPPLVKPTDGTNGEEPEVADPAPRENTGPATTNKVKTEDGKEKEKVYNPFATLPPEGGLIGKLNVRKSGKVEFDWGGTILSLGMGTETDFLTSAIMIEQNIDLQNPEASTGFACGMGQILNKFVLAPVWDEEEDWDPSLEGIDGLDQ